MSLNRVSKLRKIVLTFFGAAALALAQESKPIRLHVDSFTVMGISTVTTNKREATSDGLIPRMWARLRTENILDHIPNRIDNSIIAVYCDYENGRKASYRYVLGTKVGPTKFIPREMVVQTVQSGPYVRYSAQGSPPPVVDLWKRIWADEKPGVLAREYRTDFEVHPAGLRENTAESRVDIYIGLVR
jgi:predicted transcriptional regulator YdeE